MKKLIFYFKNNNWLFEGRFRLKMDFMGSKYSSWNIQVLLTDFKFV